MAYIKSTLYTKANGNICLMRGHAKLETALKNKWSSVTLFVTDTSGKGRGGEQSWYASSNFAPSPANNFNEYGRGRLI